MLSVNDDVTAGGKPFIEMLISGRIICSFGLGNCGQNRLADGLRQSCGLC